MKRKIIQRCRKIILIIIAMCVISTPMLSYALVYFTEESHGGVNTIYISGNPDMFPFEYYDVDAKAMRGVIPEMLGRVSREIGVDFTYVGVGLISKQLKAAKNKQVEIITGYVPKQGKDELIKSKITVTKISSDSSKDIYIAFTEAADDELIKSVTESINRFKDEEIMRLIVRESIAARGYNIPTTYRMAILFIIEIFVLILIIYLLVRGEKKRRAKAEKNMDETTGIGNRVFFRENYEKIINDNIRNLYYLAYISFDLKLVNNYYGEKIADETIKKASEIIIKNLRENEFAARLSGGAFGICFNANNSSEAGQFISSLLVFLNELEKLNGISEKGSFNAGLYFLGKKDWSIDHALYCADVAYKHAKANNKDYCISTNEMEKQADKAIKVNQGIMRAMEKKDFLPYVHFFKSGETGEIKGAEMVSRWEHPTEGLIDPYRYIETMARMGSMVDFDYHTFERACRQLEKWKESRDFFVICNLTKLTIAENRFVTKIKEIIDKYDFSHEKMIIGIVEDMREHSIEIISENIKECKELGFNIALDNVGYGYNSLKDLCEFNADIMKISVGRICNGGEAGVKLMKALSTMAHSMGMKVLAVELETDKQLEIAREAGSDYIQGNICSRAIPQKEIDNFIAEYEPK